MSSSYIGYSNEELPRDIQSFQGLNLHHSMTEFQKPQVMKILKSVGLKVDWDYDDKTTILVQLPNRTGYYWNLIRQRMRMHQITHYWLELTSSPHHAIDGREGLILLESYDSLWEKDSLV